MKYGLMYYKSTDNIGDDIQTYVAIKYLPHIDYYIDREALSCFIPEKKEYVSMIMNGWYIHNKIAWPPSPYINPLLISVHFKDREDTDVGDLYLKGIGGDYLKRHGLVGARDIETKKRLEKNGIGAYFSGCMTLTLDKFENVEKKNKICVVDVEENVIKKIEQNSDCDIEILSHFLNPKITESKSFEERMRDVEDLLKKYQQAHLVVTTRLHVMLPCIALGTPVILLHKKVYDEDRLGAFLNYADNYVEEDFLNMDIKEILEKPKQNSDKYIEIRDELNCKCSNFVQACESGNLEILSKDLPEIDEYKKYVRNLMWYKDIYEKERLALENVEKRRVQEFENYHKELLQIQENLKSEMLKNKPKSEVTISVNNVYKTFNVYLDKANTVKEKMLFFSRNHKEKREVLKGVNLEIRRGEVVALIGANGSGKSTLLKLMTKILYPNKGMIETKGKLTSLLELGAGFHPDFSGRENIYFNASIFGLTKKEIDGKLQDIISFSELENFIDNPVRTYSSGMFMRLAFSVAINVNADILLVDEILSVGDEHFQNKCINKMLDLKKQGKTMVFVTHSMETARKLCDRAIWLCYGKIQMDGDVNEVIEKYVEENR